VSDTEAAPAGKFDSLFVQAGGSDPHSSSDPIYIPGIPTPNQAKQGGQIFSAEPNDTQIDPETAGILTEEYSKALNYIAQLESKVTNFSNKLLQYENEKATGALLKSKFSVLIHLSLPPKLHTLIHSSHSI
jgi:hypothetical protein